MKTMRKHFNAMAQALALPLGMGAATQILTTYAFENEYKVGYVIGSLFLGTVINNFRLAYRTTYMADVTERAISVAEDMKTTAEEAQSVARETIATLKKHGGTVVIQEKQPRLH